MLVEESVGGGERGWGVVFCGFGWGGVRGCWGGGGLGWNFAWRLGIPFLVLFGGVEDGGLDMGWEGMEDGILEQDLDRDICVEELDKGNLILQLVFCPLVTYLGNQKMPRGFSL